MPSALPGTGEVDEVGELLIEFHPGGDGDHPARRRQVHAHFGDDVAAQVLVLYWYSTSPRVSGFHRHGSGHLARTGYLVHRQGGAGAVGVRVVPVFQRAIAVGFRQLGG